MCPPTTKGHAASGMETLDDNDVPMAKPQPILYGQPKSLSVESYSLVILLVSAILYSIMAAFIKLAAPTGVPSSQLVFMRAVFQGFFVILAMAFSQDEQGDKVIRYAFGRKEVRNVVIARGLIGGFGFLLYYYAISVLPLGDATTLLNLNPVITVLAASVALKEPVRIIHLVAAFGSVIGCILISKPSFLFSRGDADVITPSLMKQRKSISTGYIVALTGACCGAAVYILIRRAGKKGVHTLQLLFSWVTFGTIFSLFAGVILPRVNGKPSSFVWPTSFEAWMYIFGVCVFGSGGHLLMNYAGRHAPAGLSSIMRSSGIMWSYALEMFVFHELPQGPTIWGVMCIILSLAAIAVDKHHETNNQKRALWLEKETYSLLETQSASSQINDSPESESNYGTLNV